MPPCSSVRSCVSVKVRRISLILAFFLSILAASRLQADNLYAYRDSVKNGYNFLLYVPDSYETSETPLPILLCLHGKSLAGSNLSTITKYGCIDALRRGREIDALVIYPQCNTTGGWNAERLMHVVNWVMSRYRHDPDRLYCFGISMGGWGTFKFAAAYPDRVAAAIAMCGGYNGEVEPLGEVPLWILHGTSDTVTALSYSSSIVEKMAKAGVSGRLQFNWLTGCDHSILARVFLLKQAYDWLFSHRLSDENRPVNREIKIEPQDIRAAYMTIEPGHEKLLPIKNLSKKSSSSGSTTTAPPPPADGSAVYHTIVSGDTLSALARKYGTTIQDLCYLNGISEDTILQLGKKLRVR